MAQGYTLCKIDGMEICSYSGTIKYRFVPPELQDKAIHRSCNAVVTFNGVPELYGNVMAASYEDNELVVFDFYYHMYDEIRCDGTEEEIQEIIDLCRRFGYLGEVNFYDGIGTEEDYSYVYLGDYRKVFDNVLDQAFAADPESPWKVIKGSYGKNLPIYRFYNSTKQDKTSANYWFRKHSVLCRHCGRLFLERDVSWDKVICHDCLQKYYNSKICKKCYSAYDPLNEPARKKVLFFSFKSKLKHDDLCSECWNSLLTCENCSALMHDYDEIVYDTSRSCDYCMLADLPSCSFCGRKRLRRYLSTEALGIRLIMCFDCFKKGKYRENEGGFKDFLSSID